MPVVRAAQADGFQPPGERCRFFERGQLRPGAREDVLRQVFRFVVISHARIGDRHHHPAIALRQAIKRRPIPRLRAADQHRLFTELSTSGWLGELLHKTCQERISIRKSAKKGKGHEITRKPAANP